MVQSLKEVVRMGRTAQETLRLAIDGFIKEDEKLLNQSYQKEAAVNAMESELTQFLVSLANSGLSIAENNLVTGLFHTINDLERIGDHSENIAELGQSRIDNGLIFSDVAKKELNEMAEYVYSMVDNVITALEKKDFALARDVRNREDNVDRMERDLREGHIGRLNNYQCIPGSGIVFLDVISNLERIADHCSNIAMAVLDRVK